MRGRMWVPLVALCFMMMIPDKACAQETVLPKGAEEILRNLGK